MSACYNEEWDYLHQYLFYSNICIEDLSARIFYRSNRIKMPICLSQQFILGRNISINRLMNDKSKNWIHETV